MVVSGGGQPSLPTFGASLAESVPERLQWVERLRVRRAREKSQRQIRNTPIANEHLLGMTTVAGAATEALSGAFDTRLAGTTGVRGRGATFGNSGVLDEFEPRSGDDLVGAHQGARLVAPLPVIDGLLGLAAEFAIQ